MTDDGSCPSVGTQSGPSAQRLANGTHLASEAQTAKTGCQGSLPMYRHESKGVIKTEWPACSPESNVDRFSLKQHLASRFGTRRFCPKPQPKRFAFSFDAAGSCLDLPESCAGTSLGLGTPTLEQSLDSRRLG